MSIYLGVRCPVCSKKFTGTDDIVVCPTCGAPHHRECYAAEGQCAFEADHLSGKVWSAAPEQPKEEPKAEPKATICPRCNAANPPESQSCSICGMPLQQSFHKDQVFGQESGSGWEFPGLGVILDPATMMYGDVSPDEAIDSEVARDLALYVGENSAYYLGRFRDISKHGKKFSMNLSAFFLGSFYFFYRKMFLPGVCLLLVHVVGLIPYFLYSFEMLPQTLSYQAGLMDMLREYGVVITREVNLDRAQQYLNLARIGHFCIFTVNVVFSMLANRFYFHKTVGKVRQLRIDFGPQRDERAYVEALGRAGGYSKTAVIALAGGIVGAYLVMNMVFTYLLMSGS